MNLPRLRTGRKLLVATVGLASVSFVACEDKSDGPVGNLMAPQDLGVRTDALDAGRETLPPPMGNLMPPPPPDAGIDARDAAGDGGDAGAGDGGGALDASSEAGTDAGTAG